MPRLRNRFYRRPGQRGNCNRFQTARYVSRNTRWQLGLRTEISHYKRIDEGYKFLLLHSKIFPPIFDQSKINQNRCAAQLETPAQAHVVI